MKGRNVVFLTGSASAIRSEIVEVDGDHVPVTVCVVQTDRSALGGRHQVLAYGPLAGVARAFIEACTMLDVDAQCTVDGWLRSDGAGAGVVVADSVAFHVGREVADQARQLLSEFRNGGRQ